MDFIMMDHHVWRHVPVVEESVKTADMAFRQCTVTLVVEYLGRPTRALPFGPDDWVCTSDECAEWEHHLSADVCFMCKRTRDEQLDQNTFVAIERLELYYAPRGPQKPCPPTPPPMCTTCHLELADMRHGRTECLRCLDPSTHYRVMYNAGCDEYALVMVRRGRH